MSEEQIKYSSYTPAQKKASQVYRMKNKDKINEQRKKYYQARRAADPMFLEYKRKKAKEYYEKKKLDKSTSIVAKDLKVDVEEFKSMLDDEAKCMPVITETPTISEVKPDEDVKEKVEEVKPTKAKRVRKVKELVVETLKPVEVSDIVKLDVVVKPVKIKKLGKKSKSE